MVNWKIRIALVIDGMDPYLGGTEKQLLQFIEKVDKNAFEVTVISLSSSSWFKNNSFPCETVFLGYHGFFSFDIISVLLKFRKLIKQKKFDILQTFFEDSIFLTVAATRFIKKGPTLLCARRDIGLSTEHPWYHSIYRLLRPFAYRFYEGILVNAEAIKQHLVSHENAPESKIILMHNGIDSNVVPVPSPSIFLENGALFWIGLMANLTPVKRIDVFLKALALLREEFGVTDARALIIGDGPQRDELLKMSYDLGLQECVHFIGSIDNVYSFLQHLDVGVLCSDKEGLSNSILEYMACSLPVVATSVGGNTELVGKGNGICVPPADPPALASALATLAQNKSLRLQLGQNSRKILESSYSWEKTMDKYKNYYRGLLGLQDKGAVSDITVRADRG